MLAALRECSAEEVPSNPGDPVARLAWPRPRPRPLAARLGLPRHRGSQEEARQLPRCYKALGLE